ncbi:hypothetical protein L211DRAFT_557993 [Terfezia boudieri ATCC MYA-4762]|uniref:Uncharacterized protein n=1 Tax=Terfezia boudieri ATCC MYA-4762 TaxID=1051890 RepID=A0A3N4LXT0_9PEZI|nr:hypothetical protein L211DRAFT_557993 [Terfezia boudieri ATCC MYA-4762]
MHITQSQDSFLESNLYLAPPSHPPRRKSLVFLLLITVELAAFAVFVLCISRLGKEMRGGDITVGWFKVLYVMSMNEKLYTIPGKNILLTYRHSSIGYTITLTIATILFLTISISFFKVVYPAPAPFRSSFSALKNGSKAVIISNFVFSTLWCAGLGIQTGELWTTLNRDISNDNGLPRVESDGRFWVRIGISAGLMVGLLALGWCSLQGVWRNKHHRHLADELSTRTELRSGFD